MSFSHAPDVDCPRKDDPARKPQNCHNGGSTDHIKADCDQPPKPRDVICRKCGELGHKASECPTKHQCRQCGFERHEGQCEQKCKNCGADGHTQEFCAAAPKGGWNSTTPEAAAFGERKSLEAQKNGDGKAADVPSAPSAEGKGKAKAAAVDEIQVEEIPKDSISTTAKPGNVVTALAMQKHIDSMQYVAAAALSHDARATT